MAIFKSGEIKNGKSDKEIAKRFKVAVDKYIDNTNTYILTRGINVLDKLELVNRSITVDYINTNGKRQEEPQLINSPKDPETKKIEFKSFLLEIKMNPKKL